MEKCAPCLTPRSVSHGRRVSLPATHDWLLAGLVLAVLLASATYSPSAARSTGSPGSASATTGRPSLAGPSPMYFMTESVDTFSSDCAAARGAFNLGETVCARVTGSPVFPVPQRRLQWVNPAGFIVATTTVTSDPQTDSFTLPTSPTSVLGVETVSNLGTWKVTSTSTADGSVRALAFFSVSDPANAACDLSVTKTGPGDAPAGGTVSFTVEVINRGPDDAQGVQLLDDVPANTTFASEAQLSGPAFTCTNPSPGGSGTSTCDIGVLPSGAMAVFRFTYNVGASLPSGTAIFNTARASSSTNELHAADNAFTATTFATAAGGAGDECAVTCPSNITAPNDTNQCGAAVSYPAPGAAGNNCGTVICTPPSGSFFPIGATVITCGGDTGPPCTFTITVQDTRPPTNPTITCPQNITVEEETPGSGSAVVNYSTPTGTGNCVTVSCDPPSGSAFPVGSTPVTCTATDSSNNSVSCSFLINVTSSGGCVPCPGDITVAKDEGQCGAVVTFPPSEGNCGTVTCTPPSGSFFPVGSTTVNCTSTAGPSCSFTVTVTGLQLTAIGPAMIWVGLKNSDDVGTRFDLLVEVLRNNVLIGSGEIDGVPGGSSGFNNAILRTINLALADPLEACPGDTMSVRLSVRIAADGSGHRSGTARLWFNDSAADSHVTTTIGGTATDNFILDGFALGEQAGPGPKKTIDVFVDRAVGGNPFKPFGTWTRAL